MELYGIALAVPAAIVATLLYSLFVRYVVARSELWTKLFRRGSIFVLGLLAVEIALLAAFGAVRLYGAAGRLFLWAHTLVFLLGTPALANLIILRSKGDRAPNIWLAAPIPCAMLALGLVFLEYHVSETLFGVD